MAALTGCIAAGSGSALRLNRSTRALLVSQRLKRAQYCRNTGTPVQFKQNRLGGVVVGLAGIRRIGPHRVVDYLCSLLQIDVQSRLQQVHAPLQTGIADLAYASWLEFTVVAHFQAA